MEVITINHKSINFQYNHLSKIPVLCANERYIFNLNLKFENILRHGIRFDAENLKCLFPDYWEEFVNAYPEIFIDVNENFIMRNSYHIIEDLAYINEKQNFIFKILGQKPILEIINVDE